MRTKYATRAGSTTKANEDWVSVTQDNIIVLDGVTEPRVPERKCRHTVTWFTANFGTDLAHQAYKDQSLRDALRTAIQRTNDKHRQTCNLYADGLPAATVAMVRKFGEEIEYLVLSNTTVVLDTLHGLKVISDDRVNHVEPITRALATAGLIGTPKHTETIAAMTGEQLAYRNRAGGYWVADSNTEAAKQAYVGRISADIVKRIAVFTDGASRIVDTFGLMSWYEVMDYLYENGPHRLLDHIRAVELQDRDGRCWPRFKVSDDATVAYITVSGSNTEQEQH